MNERRDSRETGLGRAYRWIFLIAALHNLLGGIGFIVLYSWAYTNFGHPPPEPGIHYQMWIGIILVFGVAYWLVYRDMYANRDLVIVSILAKFVTAGVLFYAVLTGADGVPEMFVVPAVSDFVWGILFSHFVWWATTNDLWIEPVDQSS